RRAHKCPDTLLVNDIKDVNDCLQILKAHGLLPRFLLGHMIDAEELIIAEKNSIHGAITQLDCGRRSMPLNDSARPRFGEFSFFTRTDVSPWSAPAGAFLASASILESTASVSTAISNDETCV